MQELEYQYWVREQERRLRSVSHSGRAHGGIPKFSMAFQPIVNVANGGVYGYESLVRSESGDSAHSVLSRVPTEHFHTFDRACRSKAMSEAIRCGFLETGPTRLCVNVNPNAAINEASDLRRTCDEAAEMGFPLDRLVLELVEDEEIWDLAKLKPIIDEYREYGVKIAMDDFGAGYSGLKLLSRLKPDVIKLDMALVHAMDEDRTSQVIVKAIVQACFELGIVTIAEGVERYDQAMRLRDMGVVFQQGYYFARPAFEALPTVQFELPELQIGVATHNSSF